MLDISSPTVTVNLSWFDQCHDRMTGLKRWQKNFAIGFALFFLPITLIALGIIGIQYLSAEPIPERPPLVYFTHQSVRSYTLTDFEKSEKKEHKKNIMTEKTIIKNQRKTGIEVQDDARRPRGTGRLSVKKANQLWKAFYTKK